MRHFVLTEYERLARRRAASKKFYANNKDKVKAWTKAAKMLRQYGLTQDAWDALFEKQNRRCGICNTDDPGKRGWTTDHCHTSGAVRGILCNPCNLGIGHFRDSPEIISNAISYLNKS